MKVVKVKSIKISNSLPFVLIAGPCVIETRKQVFETAKKLKQISKELKIPLIFKCSYDKANRTSIKSYRGPGINKGLEIIKEVKNKFDLQVLIDVHCRTEIKKVKNIADIIQIPAFLSRQTDLIIEAAKTGKPINIKKGQFLAPEDVKFIIEKIESTGNKSILITERGTNFGYHNLVVDMRGIEVMKNFGYPVIFDATHSVQRPSAKGGKTEGDRKFVPSLIRAAVAIGVAGIFVETHPKPEKALSDSGSMLPLNDIKNIFYFAKKLDKIVKNV